MLPTSNEQKAPGWGLCTAHHRLCPLPAAFETNYWWCCFTLPEHLQSWQGTGLDGRAAWKALLHVFTYQAHCRALPCQKAGSSRAAVRWNLPASRCWGWMGRQVSHSHHAPSARAWLAGQHRNTPPQQGSSRNVFIYIKRLLYKLKERKRKKRDNTLVGQEC